MSNSKGILKFTPSEDEYYQHTGILQWTEKISFKLTYVNVNSHN